MKLIPHTRAGMLGRFGLGALIVILFTASATAVAGLLQFKQFANDLSFNPPLKQAQVTIADPGAPQTLLLIGSDHRAGTPWRTANTDTMMLVRLDPDSSTINLLSIPRDLKVQIPMGRGNATEKLNAAYSIGGPALLIRILRQQVFGGLRVNHIIDVNFGGFKALVNAIGCVYTDVDHRYYNNTKFTNYSSIDIQPGYQKLCGDDALAFVRFRHTDSDLVRNARQQDFLRWAKSQYGTSQLIANRDQLISIFGQHVQTDQSLHTVDGLINLFNLAAFSAAHTIKQIRFPAVINPCGVMFVGRFLQQVPCYVTASYAAEQQVYQQFITPTRSAPAPPPTKAKRPAGGRGGGARPASGPPDLIANVADGKAQAADVASAKMTIYYPTTIAAGSRYCTNANCPIGPVADSYPRAYQIDDQQGHWHPAYRFTLVADPQLGQYYGVQGTTWQNPPILNSPNQTRVVNGKKLLVFLNGQKIALVGWRTPSGAYWVSNTLTDDLSNHQMLGIASSLAQG